MSRLLVGEVYWAVRCGPPSSLNNLRRLTRLQKAGLAYEKKFAAAMPGAIHGQWFKYADDEGIFWCQPDFVMQFPGLLLILETKLSWRGSAVNQLGLYQAVLARATGIKRVVGLVVTKNIIRLPANYSIQHSIFGAVSALEAGKPTVLQWLGDAAQLNLNAAA